MPSPASPGTNQFRCPACGRYFNSGQELSEHERDCIPAKQATRAGSEELQEQERTPHQPNDADKKTFEHGTRRT